MGRLLVRLLINAAALWVAAYLIPDFGGELRSNFSALLLTAALFGIVNAVIRPIIALLTCPLQILTLGLFTLIINAAMLFLTASLSQSLFGIGFYVHGWGSAILASIVITVVSIVLSIFLHEPRDEFRPRYRQ